MINIASTKEFIKKSFIFSDASDEIINLIQKVAVIEKYEAKDTVKKSRVLGIILKGKIEVRNNDLLLRTLKSGDSFGYAGLFADKDGEISELIALNKVEVMYIQEQLIEQVFSIEPAIAKKYISYQADRIRYLNQRLEECAGNNAIAKLASFLLNNAQKTDSLNMRLNLSRTSEALNIGRASLYRAMNKLENDSIIKRESNLISILDMQALNNYIKNKEC